MDKEQVLPRAILVVEDDSFLARVLNERLVQEGYDVTVCKDGREGLETVKKAEHDLVLLDIILPEIDGISVLREMKNDDNLKSVAVIVLSNVSDPQRIEEAKKLGADYYTKSSTELSEIIDKIRERLSPRNK